MVGTTLMAIENRTPKTRAASSFALVIAQGAIGNGPRIAASRGSRPSASQTSRAARAEMASEAAIKRKRSGNALRAVCPGSWMYAAR